MCAKAHLLPTCQPRGSRHCVRKDTRKCQEWEQVLEKVLGWRSLESRATFPQKAMGAEDSKGWWRHPDGDSGPAQIECWCTWVCLATSLLAQLDLSRSLCILRLPLARSQGHLRHRKCWIPQPLRGGEVLLTPLRKASLQVTAQVAHRVPNQLPANQGLRGGASFVFLLPLRQRVACSVVTPNFTF